MRRPRARPCRSPLSKWIPPYRRDMPAWLAASENVAHESVMSVPGTSPGSMGDAPRSIVTAPPNTSLPVKDFRISAPAALNVL